MGMDRDIDNDDVAPAVDADDDGAWQPPLSTPMAHVQ